LVLSVWCSLLQSSRHVVKHNSSQQDKSIGKETAIARRNETGYVDAQEAARTLGMSQRAVRNLVARGRLEPRRDREGVAARLVVSVASVERLRSERNH
jgi:hypothetical protein